MGQGEEATFQVLFEEMQLLFQKLRDAHEDGRMKSVSFCWGLNQKLLKLLGLGWEGWFFAGGLATKVFFWGGSLQSAHLVAFQCVLCSMG